MVIEVNFDEPRQGPICYAANAGAQIKFSWHEQHNLHRLPDRSAYESCTFGSAQRLASAGPKPDGIVVQFVGRHDEYYSCSKICASNGHKVRICLNGTYACGGCCGFVGNGSATTSSSNGASPPSCPPPLGPAPLGVLPVLLIVCGVAALLVALVAFCRWRCRAEPKTWPGARSVGRLQQPDATSRSRTSAHAPRAGES